MIDVNVFFLFADIRENKMCRNDEFIKDIFHYFVTDSSKDTANAIIKRHTDKLAQFGDYSFPLNLQNWVQYLPSHQHLSTDNIFTYREQHYDVSFQSITDHINDFVQNSRKWTLQIERAVITENRCAIFLNRYNTFQLTLHTVLNDPNYGCYECNQSYVVVRKDTDDAEKEPLTNYRCRVVQNVIENLTKYSNGSAEKKLLYVTHKSTDLDTPDGSTQIFVGNVTSTDKKVLNVDATDYIRYGILVDMTETNYGLL